MQDKNFARKKYPIDNGSRVRLRLKGLSLDQAFAAFPSIKSMRERDWLHRLWDSLRTRLPGGVPQDAGPVTRLVPVNSSVLRCTRQKCERVPLHTLRQRSKPDLPFDMSVVGGSGDGKRRGCGAHAISAQKPSRVVVFGTTCTAGGVPCSFEYAWRWLMSHVPRHQTAVIVNAWQRVWRHYHDPKCGRIRKLWFCFRPPFGPPVYFRINAVCSIRKCSNMSIVSSKSRGGLSTFRLCTNHYSEPSRLRQVQLGLTPVVGKTMPWVMRNEFQTHAYSRAFVARPKQKSTKKVEARPNLVRFYSSIFEDARTVEDVKAAARSGSLLDRIRANTANTSAVFVERPVSMESAANSIFEELVSSVGQAGFRRRYCVADFVCCVEYVKVCAGTLASLPDALVTPWTATPPGNRIEAAIGGRSYVDGVRVTCGVRAFVMLKWYSRGFGPGGPVWNVIQKCSTCAKAPVGAFDALRCNPESRGVWTKTTSFEELKPTDEGFERHRAEFVSSLEDYDGRMKSIDSKYINSDLAKRVYRAIMEVSSGSGYLQFLRVYNILKSTWSQRVAITIRSSIAPSRVANAGLLAGSQPSKAGKTKL